MTVSLKVDSMKWTDAGPYAKTSPPYTICKAWIRESWVYTATANREILGHADTFKEAVKLCEAHNEMAADRKRT